MSNNQSNEHFLFAEFAALVAQARSRPDAAARQDLFTALLSLERRAGLAGVNDDFLLRVAEARFLAGILRESVVPLSHVGVRTARRIIAGEHDFDAVGAA